MTMMMMMLLPNIITNTSYNRFFAVDYAVLYNVLSNYKWPSLYNETSVDVAASLATDLAVPIKPNKSISVLFGFL
jgi:hypothetical protein